MKNLSHVGLVALAATMFFGGAQVTTAQAASHVKVLQTRQVRKTAYHATKGNVYSSAKLTHVKYHIKNYPHTTWYATKKATVKQHGKKVSYTFIKAGKKSGWLYSKDLIKGKAPKKAAKAKRTTKSTAAKKTPTISHKQQLRNDITAVERAVQSASGDTQSLINATNSMGIVSSYQSISDAISDIVPDRTDNPSSQDVNDASQDKTAALQIYQIFRGRFSASQNSNLATMADTLSNSNPTKKNYERVTAQISGFSTALSQAVRTLD